MRSPSFRHVRSRVARRVRGDTDLDVLVSQGLRLGKEPHIAPNIYIDGSHPWLITIGDYVTIAPYVSIISHDASLGQHTSLTRLASVTVCDRAYLGVGAILLPGTTIGEDSVVGAGAVVHGDVPPGSLVTGNPATVSPLKGVVAWQKASAKRSVSWGVGSSAANPDLSDERRQEQREALADGASGYVPVKAAPGSPFQLAKQQTRST